MFYILFIYPRLNNSDCVSIITMEIKEALFLVGNLLSILPQVPVLANARGTKGASSNRTSILSFSELQRKGQNLEKKFLFVTYTKTENKPRYAIRILFCQSLFTIEKKIINKKNHKQLLSIYWTGIHQFCNNSCSGVC